MHKPTTSTSSLRLLRVIFLAALATSGTLVRAQAFCASDGQVQPVALLERFINANCDSCWKDPTTPRAQANQAVLDWVLPGERGDDAPMSAVASRDGLIRLEALGQAVPRQASARLQRVKRPGQLTAHDGYRLRVAHGLALSGYVGVSIELKPIPMAAKKQALTAWLALVETLPPGTEGSPIPRNLIRNALQSNWDGRKQLSNKEQLRFFESRVMRLPEGLNPERMHLIGWIEDTRGQVLAAAQSRCIPSPAQDR